MRIVGVRRACGPVEIASLSDDGAHVTVVAGLDDFWADAAVLLRQEPDGPTVALAEVQQVPPFPTLFARWTASLTVGGARIPVPGGEDGVDWEGEVVAYVGSTLVDATPDEALAAVVGYSTFNDLTSRRAQKLTSQWILGTNGDGSGPLGPQVNGELVQDGSTAEMVYTVGDTLSLISHTFTLRPGDLLATGTPSGVGYARIPPWLPHPGDVVEIDVERLGTVANPIVADDHRRKEQP